MKTNRRSFIKKSSIGMSIMAVNSFHNLVAVESVDKKKDENLKHVQYFNMCGYRAPKLQTVRVGCVGIGNRGYANLKQLTFIDGVEIKAICDLMQFRIDDAQRLLSDRNLPAAKAYIGNKTAIHYI